MTYEALIKFAPLATLERHNSPAWNRADRTLYDSGSLSLLPRKAEVPLLVDHQDDQQVGIVHSIFRADLVDVVAGKVESGPWLVASATVADPPRWLRKHETKASFAFLPLQHSSFTQPGDAEHLRKGWITEVSLLSPGTEPAEPLACVTFLRTAEAATPAVEVIRDGPILIRRNIGQVTAIGGRAVRTRQGNPIRYVGDDIVIDRADGSQVIYCGREGRAEAIRDGVLTR